MQMSEIYQEVDPCSTGRQVPRQPQNTNTQSTENAASVTRWRVVSVTNIVQFKRNVTKYML